MGDLSGREGSGGMWVPVEIMTPTCLQNHGAVEQWRIVTQPDLHPKPHTKKKNYRTNPWKCKHDHLTYNNVNRC
jgi:hypothetical protein